MYVKKRLVKYLVVLASISLTLAVSLEQFVGVVESKDLATPVFLQKLEPLDLTSTSVGSLLPVSNKTLAQNTQLRYISYAPDDDITLATRLDLSGIRIHPGTEFRRDSKPTARSLNHCKALVYKAFYSLPDWHRSKLKDLTLFFSDKGTRGLGGDGTIILRCQNVTDYELTSVFIHEIGHIVDTGGFHFLSWNNNDTAKSTSTRFDFVSGYASTDPYEDFAESYLYYVLHGTQFRELGKTNNTILQKYEFLKKNLFSNQEFSNEVDRVSSKDRPFDATLLPFKLKNFWQEQAWN